jgi:hypothetical protein
MGSQRASEAPPAGRTQRVRAGAAVTKKSPDLLIEAQFNSSKLVVVDHSRAVPDVGFMVPLDDSFVFNGSALLDNCLFAVAIAMNDYAGRRSGTNSDSDFFGCGGHHVANASNGQSRECKSFHQLLLSLVAK